MSNPTPNSNPKKSKGRRKVEMKKMTNGSNLQVTFSKRRSGLFKKASELCTLCGAEVALIVFSPAHKAFSFGHPSVGAIIDKYKMRCPQYNQDIGTMQFIEAHRNSNVRELNALLTNINADLETEKKCSDELNQQRKVLQEQCWWATPIQEMNNPEQLDQLKLALKNLKKDVLGHVEKQLSNQGGAANNPQSQFFAGGSSSSNNNLQLSQLFPAPPPSQVFPVHQPHQMLHNQPMMMPNHLFDGSGMMHHPTFNNMDGFGPASRIY
ncbi:PREDICTED: agamous-like MADS-box protein AGL62 [Lupinus angustifolius]|uniref:agamous-like MADS-box protein AGL62 n=1 Tax=Lupinus angustifolius TaxID=3871 RepID=UPI00092F6742|nr:PREDICTED: agamous-like MADS-box protein AGL62 [Lupinus angustifolius]